MSPAAPAQPREDQLLQCLYALPVALWRIDGVDGRIGLLNARAASLLQELGVPLAGADGFALLRSLDASLAARAEARWLTPGIVAARHRVRRTDVHGTPRVLAVTVQVLNPAQGLMTVEEAWNAADGAGGAG